MPFAFLIVGTMFIVSGIRGTDSQLFTLIKGDFSSSDGKQSFIAWMFAILLIGSLGYIEAIKPVSRAFLVLIVIVLFLSNGGFFQKFVSGIESKTPLANNGTSNANNPDAVHPELSGKN